MIVALLIIVAQAAAAPDPRVALVESAIRAQLKDPDSAKFSWPYGFIDGAYKPMMGGAHVGPMICGTVNAKNGYGGYSGQYAVVGVVFGDRAITDMDEPGPFTAHAGWVADQCRKAGEPVL